MFCNLLVLLAVLLIVAANAHDHSHHDHDEYIRSIQARIAVRKEALKNGQLPTPRIEEAEDLVLPTDKFTEKFTDNGPYVPFTGKLKMGKAELTVKEFRANGHRCGIREKSGEVPADLEAKIGEYQARRESSHLRTAGGEVIDIPVYFNIFITDDGSQGNIPNRFVDRQIEVLNNAYASTGFHFTLMRKKRIYSSEYYHLTQGSDQEWDSKLLYNVPGPNILNIYTGEGDGYLGWSYFPEDAVANEELNSVNLYYASLPGGEAEPYNKGDTLVHEVGHWLGLHHTFNAGCGKHNKYGDGVQDTPAEAEPAFDCEVRDSCPGQRGNDPIHNFMDYTDDRCLTQFTAGQTDRMHAMWDTYRAVRR